MSDTTIRIIIDASGARSGGSQAERALDRVGAASRRLNGALGSATVNVSTFGRSLAGLKGAGAALILADLSRMFMDLADKSALMDAKLRLATDGWGSYAQAQRDVQNISRTTRSEITSTAVLYGKLSASGKLLDASQAQVARATETVTKSLKVSGASAGETASTVLQLGQALSSGKLNGDEFRSLAENSPRLMKLLSDSLGVPIGALKKMASEGELTADKLFRAFTDTRFTAALDEEFKRIPKTFGDAFTAIGNIATVAFGAFNEGGEFSQSLYAFADQGSGNMTSIADAARASGGEIRDTFAGLQDAFQPLLDGATQVFNTIFGQVASLKDQVAGLLGTMDTIANAPRRLQNWANDFDNKWFGTNKPMAEMQNYEGEFRQGFAQSKRDRARARAERVYKERTGNDVKKGTTDDQLVAGLNALGPKPKKTGGSGNLRAPLGTATEKKPKKTDAEREAEKAAKLAERQQKAVDEMWQAREEDLALAKLQNVEAERLSAQYAFQQAGGKALSDTDKARLATLMDQTRAAKLLTDITAANDNSKGKLEFQKRRLGMTDKEAAMAEAAWEFESRALAEKVDITNGEFQKQLEMVKSRAGETYEIEKQNRLLKSRDDLLATYSKYEGQQQELEQITSDRKQLDVLRGKSVADGGITEDQYRRALDGLNRAGAEVATRFHYEMGNKIDDLGNQLGGVLGKAVSKFGKLLSGLADAAKGSFGGLGAIGGLLDMIGKRSDGTLNGVGDAAAKASKETLDKLMGGNGETSAIKNPLKSLSDGFSDFKGDLKNIFGKNGDFTKGLGSTLGKAGAGMQMGETADGLMKALGLKSSKLGAQIGGGIGNAIGGPIGGIIGSIGGGLVGGMFKKTPKASATSGTNALGQVDIGKASGSKKLREAVDSMVAGYGSAVKSLQDQLGADLAGNFNLGTLGSRKNKFTYDASGTGKTKGSGVQTFSSADDALEAALNDAINRGLLTGITDFSQRVLRAAKDLDRAAALASKYENIVKELAAIDDPIGAPLAELNKEFKKLRDEMVANSATAAELANVDRYYMVQRENMLKDQLSDLKSFRDKLTGEGSGLSNKSQLDSKMGEFRKYEADIAAGKAIDTAAFSTLGSSIYDLAKSLYGTATAQFQNIRGELLSANDRAVGNVKSIYEADGSANVVQALDAQTQLVAQSIKEQQKGNTIQERILELLQNPASNNVFNSGAINGRQAGTV